MSEQGDMFGDFVESEKSKPIVDIHNTVLALIERHEGSTIGELWSFCKPEDKSVVGKFFTLKVAVGSLEEDGYIRQGGVRKCAIREKDAVVWWIAQAKDGDFQAK